MFYAQVPPINSYFFMNAWFFYANFGYGIHISFKLDRVNIWMAVDLLAKFNLNNLYLTMQGGVINVLG